MISFYYTPADSQARLTLYHSPDGEVWIQEVGNNLRIEETARQGEWIAIRATNDAGVSVEAWAGFTQLEAAYLEETQGIVPEEESEPAVAFPTPSSGTEMPPPEEIIPSLEYRTPGRTTGERYLKRPGEEKWYTIRQDRQQGWLVYHNNDSNTWGALGRIDAIDRTHNKVTVVFNQDPNCVPNYDHAHVGHAQGGVICDQRTYTVGSVWIKSAKAEIKSDRYPSGFDGTSDDLEAGDLVFAISSPSVVVEPAEGDNSVMIMGFQ